MNYSLLRVPPHHMQRTAFKAQVTISLVLNHPSLTTAFIQCSATNVQLASTRSICPCEIIPAIKTIAIILSVAAHSCSFLGHSLTALAVVAWAPQWTSPRFAPQARARVHAGLPVQVERQKHLHPKAQSSKSMKHMLKSRGTRSSLNA